MAAKFGTSGLRGLVSDLDDATIHRYVCAFLSVIDHGGVVHVGYDLRDSSPGISEAVINAARIMGVSVVDHGEISTPALAFTSLRSGGAAIMVTGSHIPADRNGLKFYTPRGEIAKQDELNIVDHLGTTLSNSEIGAYRKNAKAADYYIERYVKAFGAGHLEGMRLGVYEHSSVAREIVINILRSLGADIISIGRSEHFIPIDTEAVDNTLRQSFEDWCLNLQLDAIISTDGDGDRPLVTDEFGHLVPGDVLGPLTALLVRAELICTPISSNGLVDQIGFDEVCRTKIGSPFVISEMMKRDGAVIGYEANGGFILGFECLGPEGALEPLMTRDCMLPILACLSLAKQKSMSVSRLISTLPSRFTATDRLPEIPSVASQEFIDKLQNESAFFSDFFSGFEGEYEFDLTDGLRISFSDETIVHLRPSGNAPELRCYVEAGAYQDAQDILASVLKRLTEIFSSRV